MNFDSDEGKALTYEDSSRSSAHVQHVQPAGRRCFSRGLEPCRSRYIHSSRRGQLLTCSLSESTPPHRDYTCYALASSFCHRAYAKFQGARLSSDTYTFPYSTKYAFLLCGDHQQEFLEGLYYQPGVISTPLTRMLLLGPPLVCSGHRNDCCERGSSSISRPFS